MKKIRAFLASLNDKINGNHGATLAWSVIKLVLLSVAVLAVLFVAEKVNNMIWQFAEQITTRDLIIVACTVGVCVLLGFWASRKKDK